MTDFTDEQKAAIRAAIQQTIVGVELLPDDAYADKVLAALEKPAPGFREGEIVILESPNCHKGTPVRWEDGRHFCRRLRLSEMPQAVEDLRDEMEGFTVGKWPPFVQRAAREALDAFDEQIERNRSGEKRER